MQPEPYTNQLWPFTVITTRKEWVIAVVNTLHILGSEYLKGSHTGISSSLGISVPLPKKSGPFGSVRSLKMLEDGEKQSSNFSCHLLLDRRYAKHSSLIQHAWSSNVKSEVIVTWDCYPAWHSYLTHVPLSRMMITGLSCSCNPLDGALKNRWKQGFGFFTTAYTVRMSKKSATKVVVTSRHLKPFLSGFRTLQWC